MNEEETKKRTGRPRTSSRTAIAAAAQGLFREHGYANTTIEMIAVAAGLSPRSFFTYFDSKPDVVYHIFDAGTERFSIYLERLSQEMSPVRALAEATYEAFVGRVEHSEVDVWRRIVQEAPELRTAWYMRTDKFVDTVADFLASRSEISAYSLVARTAVRAFFGVADGVVEYWMYRGGGDIRVYFDEAVTPLVRGYESVLGELALLPKKPVDISIPL